MKPLSIHLAMMLALATLFGSGTVAHAQPPAAPPTAGAGVQTLHNIQPYYPARPIHYVRRPLYGWPGVHHAATAAESFARGQAAVIRAQGQYNLLTAEARVVHSEAQQREIENREQWINSYFATRETNRQERATERGPRATVDQLRRMAASGKPAALSPSELDAATGEISWPALLQSVEYSGFRAELDKVFAERAATGLVGADALVKARQATDRMLEELKTHVREVPSQAYIAARRFIESLAYEVDRPAS
jgi:hypothetical protein